MNVLPPEGFDRLWNPGEPQAAHVEPPHIRRARESENRALLGAILDSPGVRSARCNDLYRAIAAGMHGARVNIDLSACHERSVHELDPKAAQALVAVLNEPGSHITLPPYLNALPAWIYECAHVGSVQVPDFKGGRVDLSSWKTDGADYPPCITLFAHPNSYPRVLVPPHLTFVGGERVALVARFASDQDLADHGSLLSSCLNHHLLRDPRISGVVPFVEQDFIKLIEDEENPPTVELREPAIAVIVNYYGERYGTAISMPRYPDGAVLRLDDEGAIDHLRSAVDSARSREPGADFRFAFILRVDDVHWAPLIYLRESDKTGERREAIFYPDSLGVEMSAATARLARGVGLPLFVLSQGRQSDVGSCVTDALIWSRDITMRSPDNSYELSGLLRTIAFEATTTQPAQGWPELRLVHHLPHMLFKTAQRSAFLDMYPPSEPPTFHVRRSGAHETIQQFRQRHTEVDVPVIRKGKEVRKDIAHYARFKGFHFVRTAWMQHVHQELARVFGDDYSAALAQEFIAKAKQHIPYMGALTIDRGKPDPMESESGDSQDDLPT